jgi:tRNA threonylcarbamoyladenosine biosynthesis protein TsaB
LPVVILAADTTTEVNTVALTRDEELLAETVVYCRRKHSERLIDTVDWLLKECDLSNSDLDLLAISHGPGSFTGLRIGAATWKGLAFALGKPLIGVPTLDALARLAPIYDGKLLVALDARMGEVFGAFYSIISGKIEKIGNDHVLPMTELVANHEGPLYCMGDGAWLYRNHILEFVPEAIIASPWKSIPRASAVAIEAYHMHQHGVDMDASRLSPIYLRQSQAEANREKGMSQKNPI